MISYNKSRKEQQVDKEVEDFFVWVESEAAKYEVTCEEIINRYNVKTHERLENLAEDAEDYLSERNVPLYSHSYENIIAQAVRYGFTK